MEQERCTTTEGLFTMLTNKLKSQNNETMKSLQFHMLGRQRNVNTEEWMGRLRLAAVESNYKEIDRQLKQQFIQGLNDNDMLAEIIREPTKAEESTAATSEQVLFWANRMGAQRVQPAIITSLSKTKEYDKIKTIKGDRDTIWENQKHVPKCPGSRIAVILAPAIHPDNAQPIWRSVWSAARSPNL